MSNCQTLGTNDYYEAFIKPFSDMSLNDYRIKSNCYLSRKQVNQTIGYLYIPKTR